MIIAKYFPSGRAQNVFAIDYEKLYRLGYRGLIFDVDNTLVHHGDPATSEVDDLFRRLHALGFQTVLVSNNNESRLADFTANIDTAYIADAGKPSPGCYLQALELMGVTKGEAIVIGDQIFTDICGANQAGLASILVHFIRLPGEWWIGKRRYLEKLIMLAYRLTPGSRGELGDIELK